MAIHEGYHMGHIHKLYDFTASAFIVHPSKPLICLHHHKKHNSWMQPGGHVELDEDPLSALERELEEEVGLKSGEYEYIERTDQPRAHKYKYIPLPLTINVHPITDEHKHIDHVFLVRSRKVELSPQEGESQSVKWFSQNEIKALKEERSIFEGVYDTCVWIFENVLTS